MSTSVNQWRELPLSEAVLVNPTTSLERGKVYPFVEMAAITPGSRDVKCSEQREFTGGGSKFRHRDTLMARITPCLENGKIARFDAPENQPVGHGSTEFIVIRGRPGVSDNDFAYYLTISPEVRHFAISQMTGSSGRQRVPTDAFDGISIPLPSLNEQKAIASVLGALDDKIELNRRMNVTLESMAQALFKSMFQVIDESNLADGWRISTIGEEVRVVGGSTPSTTKPEFWDDGIHHWATPKDLSNLESPVLLETERRITDAGLAEIGSGLLPAGTVLLSSRAPIGYLAISEVPVAVNQGFIAMVCHKALPKCFVWLWTKNNLETIKGRANGTTFMEISKANFRPLTVAVPPPALLTEFTRQVEPLYHRMVSNLRASKKLAHLRDSLLPELLSGELSVAELVLKEKDGAK